MDNMNINNIKSYAFQNKKTVNDFKSWEKEYTYSLRTEVFVEKQKQGFGGKIYDDPDAGNEEYYMQLSNFLNAQEKEYIPESEQFQYCVGSLKGKARVKVCKKGDYLFFLKSDQFGFSAPKTENKTCHPYSLYYEQNKDKAKAIENIVKWVYITRSLGGSFLWPEEAGWLQPPYNQDRGGSINSRRSSYINDRVDLTLLEIMHFYKIYKADGNSFGEQKCELEKFISKYQEKFPFDMLGYTLEKSPNLYKWLRHFNDIDTFLRFFMFNMFVEREKVIDITNSNPNSIHYLDEIEKKEDRDKLKKNFWSIFEKEEDLKNSEAMFDFLCGKIVERTNNMDNIA